MPRPIIVRLCSNGDYWQARWVLPGGRRVSRSLGAKADIPRRAAEVECAKIGREIEKSTAARLGQKAPRLSEFLERYILHKFRLRASSMLIQTLVVSRIKKFWAHNPTIDSITSAEAFQFRDWLSKTKFKATTAGKKVEARLLSESSVARHLTVARHVFKLAVDEEIIARNPFKPIKIPAIRSDKQWSEITHQDLERILEACPDDAYRCLFGLARLAGLRQGEAMRLKWEDIHFDRGILVVRGIATIRTTKSYTRQTPIQPRLAALLLQARDRASPGSAGPCDGVLTNNLYRRVEKILTLAGVPHYSKPFHTLRKNLVTDWLDQHPPLAVASWLGHDIRVATEFYHRSRPEMMARVTGVQTGTEQAQQKADPSKTD